MQKKKDDRGKKKRLRETSILSNEVKVGNDFERVQEILPNFLRMLDYQIHRTKERLDRSYPRRPIYNFRLVN